MNSKCPAMAFLQPWCRMCGNCMDQILIEKLGSPTVQLRIRCDWFRVLFPFFFVSKEGPTEDDETSEYKPPEAGSAVLWQHGAINCWVLCVAVFLDLLGSVSSLDSITTISLSRTDRPLLPKR